MVQKQQLLLEILQYSSYNFVRWIEDEIIKVAADAYDLISRISLRWRNFDEFEFWFCNV